MKSFDDISARLSAWLETTAKTVLAARAGLRRAPAARLVEQADGAFLMEQAPAPGAQSGGAPGVPVRFEPDAAIEASARAALSGSDVELVLRPERFLFRPLELPGRAAEFLDGVVRSQIDRLTPWTAAEAAFGCRPLDPAADERQNGSSGERLRLLVAATSHAALAPFVEAARGFGVGTLAVYAAAPDPGGATIAVCRRPIAGALDAGRLKRILGGVLLGLWAGCALALLLSSFGGQALESRREEAAVESQRLRAALMREDDASSGAAAALRARKASNPAAVLLYDELARVLPDDAYLNELRIAPDKIQIAGLARDPPALIGLMERSPHFAHAMFYAPTTASSAGGAQHFFIEAQIAPDSDKAAAP
ncbi:PilN domain-containing protein [Methylocella sp.]|uniref:PilN domain-containing protein n=1 Tax=Methylocella sp. TaxID=1978226 RepID=UPI0037848002